MNLLAEFAQYWTTHLWSASLQVTIFIFFVFLISICFKRFPARYKYILWLLVLVRLAVPTSITSPLGIGQYPERFLTKGIQWVSKQQFLPPSQPPIAQKTFPEIQLETMEAARASFGNPATVSTEVSSMDDSVPPLWSIWLSVVLVLVLAIITRIVLFRRRTRSLYPITHPDLVAAVHRLRGHLNIKRPIKLLEASEADSIQFPSVHGILRPTIIMPAGMAASWTTDDLEPLLLHELTHVKRRDCLVNFAQIVLQVLYFYHPMVWFANWIIRREREFACDDDVVRNSSGCPNAYVRSMLRIAETAVKQRRHQLLGIAMADNFSNLGRRIRRMMNKGYRVNQQSGLTYLGAIFLLGIFCVAVSAQGPERPTSTAQVNNLVKELPDVSGEGLATVSGPLGPALEGRIQTESIYDTSQPSPVGLVVSMLHQKDSIDPPTDSSKVSRTQNRTEIPYDGDKIVMTADRQVKEGKTLHASGNVVIAFRDMVITGDETKYDEETRRVLIRGQIKFSQKNVSLISSRAEFDFDTQTGTFYDASGNFSDASGRQFSFTAGIVRKTGDNKFQMYKDAVIYESLQPMKQSVEDEDLPIEVDLNTNVSGLQTSVVPPDKVLFETGSEYLEQSQYIKARLAFQTLINMYPDSDLVIPSYLAIGDAYYNEGGTENLLQAEDQYKNFVIFYPQHPNASEAQMKIISAHMKKMRSPDRDQLYTHRAEEEIKKFLERFPDSEYVPIVRQFLSEVQKAHVDENRVTPSQESGESDPKEYYKKWLNEDVAYIISEEEREAFLSTITDEERESFITQFWLRRDPTPETLKNEFKEEHYSRIAYANGHFASNVAGWKTDRGRVYIMYGKPDQIESHLPGGHYARPTGEGGGSTATFPYEKWWYRHIDGLGSDVEIEFVDSSMSGEYRMAMSPGEKIMQGDDDFFGPLVFDIRTDYIQQSPDKILVRIVIELNNKDLEFIKEQGLNRATVNVYGLVTSLTNRIMAEWEDEIVSDFPDESFENGQNKHSTYQRTITLPPGQRYKLDLVLKDVNGKKAGTRTMGLDVPKYDGGEP